MGGLKPVSRLEQSLRVRRKMRGTPSAHRLRVRWEARVSTGPQLSWKLRPEVTQETRRGPGTPDPAGGAFGA